ncbi:MAG: alkaline phosphatase family protein [Candidatus Aminicenantes bacterium]
MKKLIAAAAVLIVAAAVLFFFFLKPPAPPPKVMVIGLDGADWNIINPLLEQNKLPHLRSLIENGSSGVFHTVRPTKSPVLWTSIGTGKSMLKHGVLDWNYVDKNNIEIPYSVDDIQVKFAWEILGDYGHTAGVINWFCTFPATPVNGFLVSDIYTNSIDKYLECEEITYPPELYPKIYPKVIRFHDRKFKTLIDEEKVPHYLQRAQQRFDSLPDHLERQLRFFRRFFLQDKSVERTALYLMNEVPVDFFAVYLRLIDTTSHFASLFLEEDLRRLWIHDNENLGGPSPETERKLYRNMAEIIAPVYVYMDNVVGRLKAAAPPETFFFIVSDHGFNFSTAGYNHYDTPEIAHGIIIISGPNVKPGSRLNNASIFDLTPTLLSLYGIPLGEDMDGKVIQDAFSRRLKVKTIPSHDNGGRDPGPERPRESDEKILEELRTLGYIK